MTIELRARIGDPESELAISQGCACKTDKDSCLVHSDVDAYVVEYTFMGRKKKWELGHPNTFLCIPIKYEIKFFKDPYKAACEWHSRHKLLETRLIIKRKGKLSPPTSEQRHEMLEMLELELAGM